MLVVLIKKKLGQSQAQREENVEVQWEDPISKPKREREPQMNRACQHVDAGLPAWMTSMLHYLHLPPSGLLLMAALPTQSVKSPGFLLEVWRKTQVPFVEECIQGHYTHNPHRKGHDRQHPVTERDEFLELPFLLLAPTAPGQKTGQIRQHTDAEEDSLDDLWGEKELDPSSKLSRRPQAGAAYLNEVP